MNTFVKIPCLLFWLFLAHGADAQIANDADPLLEQEYPEEQAEIKKLVFELYDAIGKKDFERSKTFHAYTDKFTAFYSGHKRKNSEGAIEFERNLHHNIPEGVHFDIQDLKVNVFDKLAVATFHIYVDSVVEGQKKHSQAQVTLIYIKKDKGWKITHEHVSPLMSDQEK